MVYEDDSFEPSGSKVREDVLHGTDVYSYVRSGTCISVFVIPTLPATFGLGGVGVLTEHTNT